jgi:hypothetical protein
VQVVTTKVQQNGQTQPKAGTTCAKLWNLADAHKGDRQSVLKAAQEVGINPATAKTQLARWRTFNGIVGRTAKTEAAA